jgi:hypothetical protein
MVTTRLCEMRYIDSSEKSPGQNHSVISHSTERRYRVAPGTQCQFLQWRNTRGCMIHVKNQMGTYSVSVRNIPSSPARKATSLITFQTVHTVQSRFHWSTLDTPNRPTFKDEVIPKIWRHLVDNTETRLSQGLVLALFFILHLQSIGIDMSQDPNGFKPIRKRQFKRFGNWVPCRCGCGREWNFATRVGLQRNQNGKCRAASYLNGHGVIFHWRGRRNHEANLRAWKMAPG